MDKKLLPVTAQSQVEPPLSSLERVQAWNVSQTTEALNTLSISSSPPTRPSPAVRGTTVQLSIPLDDTVQSTRAVKIEEPTAAPLYRHRSSEHLRRDSLTKREALLKGKEGSRQRRRWENDRLLNNPWAQPPLPSDWEVHPTHPRPHVPYFLAPLWDVEYARSAQRRTQRAHKPLSSEEKVTQELRAKLKRSRGAKGLLQDLESEVRGFVQQWEEKARQLEREGLIEPDTEDEEEEIVFVGRNGAMSDEQKLASNDKSKEGKQDVLEKDKLIFESLVDDHGAAFGRYLVHSIAQYYGLKTWSVTRGHPARREAYVGVKTDPKTRMPSLFRNEMPRPLWAVV